MWSFSFRALGELLASSYKQDDTVFIKSAVFYEINKRNDSYNKLAGYFFILIAEYTKASRASTNSFVRCSEIC